MGRGRKGSETHGAGAASVKLDKNHDQLTSVLSKKTVIITGGAGFLGLQLAKDLIKTGRYRVVLLDVQEPPESISSVLFDAKEDTAVSFSHADVRDKNALKDHFTGCHAVFHIASYGMSGSSQLRKSMVRSINVEGTKAVVDACVVASVPHLIATSTYNVVFGGSPIDGGDESMPYFNIMSHVDEYSRSKTEAEMLVLEAHGTPVSHGTRLRTIALRPAAIWGKGETRHMERVYQYMKKGLFFFRFGSKDAKMDFVHVNNLSRAHVLALEHLEQHPSGGGKAYFISDGEDARINNFDFFSQLPIGLGYPQPFLSLPLPIVYAFATVTEICFEFFRMIRHGHQDWVPFEPLLTRAEVLKAGVHHWCSIDRARKDLGYIPQHFRFDLEVLEQFKERDRQTMVMVRPKRFTVYTRSITSVAVVIVLLLIFYN